MKVRIVEAEGSLDEIVGLLKDIARQREEAAEESPAPEPEDGATPRRPRVRRGDRGDKGDDDPPTGRETLSFVEAHHPVILDRLTDREKAILRRLMVGDTNKRIAGVFGICENTVKSHIKNLMRKMNFETRHEAAMWAVAHLHPVPVGSSTVLTSSKRQDEPLSATPAPPTPIAMGSL